jgi:Protein of unknown function (DUF1579)
MWQRVLRTLGLVTVVAVAGSAWAQQPDFKIPQPGPEHKVLEPLVGAWRAKAKIYLDPSKPPQDAEGVMMRKWIMDGRFLQEEFDGKLFGMTFKGMGVMGYDPQKKKYVSSWVDNMTLSIMTSTGDYDAKTKTLTSYSEQNDPSGMKVKTRDVVRIIDNDHHVLEMYRTPEKGKETKMMEVDMVRVKPSAKTAPPPAK